MKIEIDGKRVDWHMREGAKTKWLKALRSGKYKQGDGVLYREVYVGDDDKAQAQFCCLGVYGRCVSKLKLEEIEGRDYLSETAIPRTVQNNLSNMNDIKNLSFKRIANWIERNL